MTVAVAKKNGMSMIQNVFSAIHGYLPILLLVLAGLVAFGFVSVPKMAEAQERIERKVRVGGAMREFTVFLPANVSRKSDLRVMIVYHPAIGTGGFMEDATNLHQVPGSENFIVVYPDGYRRTWNAGTCCGMAEKQNIDDLGFFQAIMADVGSMASVRPKAYVTGFSNGALMVYYLMCKLPDQVAAAAPFAAYLPPETLQDCAPGRVPLLHMHGDKDPGAPVEGGMTNYLGFLPPARQSVETIARRNGCNLADASYRDVPELGTSCLTFSGPSASCEASLCVIPDLGHVWPGMKAKGRKFGPARPDLDGSGAVINFFLRH